MIIARLDPVVLPLLVYVPAFLVAQRLDWQVIRERAGFRTAIPMPEEVLTYPGRGPDWGARVKLLGLTIEDGVATVNFSQEMQAYGGGSARVQNIRAQIVRTLVQFPSVDEVRIAEAGQTEGVLQP